jgi:hypothetical protein
VPPLEKALFHHVSGAGKSKVTREFFDLNAEDLDEIASELDRRVDHNLRAGE